MKLPAFQFYPGDWRKDPAVQALDYTERGVWLELLCLMHESDERGKLMVGGKPYPTERLARMLNLTPGVMGGVIDTLITLGVAKRCETTGALMSSRMVKDEARMQKAREAGKKGGNPSFDKGKPNPYHKGEDKGTHKGGYNPKITPSSSSSVSSSDSSFALSSASADRPSVKPRERNPLLDALAACDGSKPEQVTGSAWGAIAKALKEIKEVSPDVTPEEIARRARNYAKEFKDAAISPSALAKHWARCQSSASVRQMAPAAPSLPEPTGWRVHLNKEHPDSPLAEGGEREARRWEDLDRSSQQWLTKEMAA